MAEEILLDTVEKNLAAFSGQVRYRAAIQRISGSDIVPWYGLVPVQSLSSLCCRVQETQKKYIDSHVRGEYCSATGARAELQTRRKRPS